MGDISVSNNTTAQRTSNQGVLPPGGIHGTPVDFGQRLTKDAATATQMFGNDGSLRNDKSQKVSPTNEARAAAGFVLGTLDKKTLQAIAGNHEAFAALKQSMALAPNDPAVKAATRSLNAAWGQWAGAQPNKNPDMFTAEARARAGSPGARLPPPLPNAAEADISALYKIDR
jgi:hypothetical protein